MMNDIVSKANNTLDRLSYGLAVLGGICLLAMVVIVALGVVMRYFLNTPLLGVNEFVQLTAVALVMSALPYCTSKNEHVAVDVFERALGTWGRLIGDLLSRGLSAFVLAVLARRAYLKTLDAHEWGDATNMLLLPLAPFYAILALGAALCALIYAMQFLLILMGGRA